MGLEMAILFLKADMTPEEQPTCDTNANMIQVVETRCAEQRKGYTPYPYMLG